MSVVGEKKKTTSDFDLKAQKLRSLKNLTWIQMLEKKRKLTKIRITFLLFFCITLQKMSSKSSQKKKGGRWWFNFTCKQNSLLSLFVVLLSHSVDWCNSNNSNNGNNWGEISASGPFFFFLLFHCSNNVSRSVLSGLAFLFFFSKLKMIWDFFFWTGRFELQLMEKQNNVTFVFKQQICYY